jgi:hypothetical protein
MIETYGAKLKPCEYGVRDVGDILAAECDLQCELDPV